MKQRLAIAATLLKDPQLLILDEPTNGLDPAGIREIRDTIRDLGEPGVTVLLSSHILAEVQQVCTSATIIGNGRMLATGTVEDLLGAGTSYRVVVADPDAARRVLERRRLHGVTATATALRRSRADHPRRSPAPSARRGIWLAELMPVRPDLETVFLELTADDTLGQAGGGRAMRLLGSSSPGCAGAGPSSLLVRGLRRWSRRSSSRSRPGTPARSPTPSWPAGPAAGPSRRRTRFIQRELARCVARPRRSTASPPGEDAQAAVRVPSMLPHARRGTSPAQPADARRRAAQGSGIGVAIAARRPADAARHDLRRRTTGTAAR